MLEVHPRVSIDTFISCICEEMKTKGTSFTKTVIYVKVTLKTVSNNLYSFEMQARQILH